MADPPTLTYPTCNVLGTPPLDLIEAYDAAAEKLTEAYTALRSCSPSGRDYPTMIDLHDAALQHHARLAAVDQARSELVLIISHIAANGGLT